MLRLCLLYRSMPIGVACRTLGFQTPPTNKRDLKKRFVELTKENHPDLHADDEKAATARMVQLTEAYTCLKSVLEHGVQYQANAAASAVHRHRHHRGGTSHGGGDGAAASGAGGHDAEWAEVTATFRAPGSSLSLRGFTLPWQRSTSSTAAAALEAKLQEPHLTFGEFLRYARQVEREHTRKEERVREDAATADGTHGFTAAYFEHTQHNSAARRGDAGGAAGLPSTQVWALAAYYYGRRLRRAFRQAPRNAWHTIRYVFMGH